MYHLPLLRSAFFSLTYNNNGMWSTAFACPLDSFNCTILVQVCQPLFSKLFSRFGEIVEISIEKTDNKFSIRVKLRKFRVNFRAYYVL